LIVFRTCSVGYELCYKPARCSVSFCLWCLSRCCLTWSDVSRWSLNNKLWCCSYYYFDCLSQNDSHRPSWGIFNLIEQRQSINLKTNLTLCQVCREFQRGNCKRAESDCRFAHPPDHVQVDATDGVVTVCMDFVKGRCSREQCRYFHPPPHLQAQLKAAQTRANSAALVGSYWPLNYIHAYVAANKLYITWWEVITL
jgi:hypothetical protein